MNRASVSFVLAAAGLPLFATGSLSAPEGSGNVKFRITFTTEAVEEALRKRPEPPVDPSPTPRPRSSPGASPTPVPTPTPTPHPETIAQPYWKVINPVFKTVDPACQRFADKLEEGLRKKREALERNFYRATRNENASIEGAVLELLAEREWTRGGKRTYKISESPSVPPLTAENLKRPPSPAELKSRAKAELIFEFEAEVPVIRHLRLRLVPPDTASGSVVTAIPPSDLAGEYDIGKPGLLAADLADHRTTIELRTPEAPRHLNGAKACAAWTLRSLGLEGVFPGEAYLGPHITADAASLFFEQQSKPEHRYTAFAAPGDIHFDKASGELTIDLHVRWLQPLLVFDNSNPAHATLERLESRHLPVLVSSPARIPTASQIAADRDFLASSRDVLEVKGADISPAGEDTITFHLTRPEMIASQLKVSLGVDYRPDTALTGSLGVELKDLVDNLGDRFALKFTGGEFLQMGDFDFSISPPSFDHYAPQWTIDDLKLHGAGGNDTDYLLGNGGRGFAVQSYRASISSGLRFDSFTHADVVARREAFHLARAPLQHIVVFRPALFYENFEFTDGDIPASVDQQGASAGLRLELNYTARLDFRQRHDDRGFSGIDFVLSNRVDIAVPHIGAFDYQKYFGEAEARITCRIFRPRDFYLRPSLALAVASSGTPAYAQTRLGDPDIFLGFEEGEIIGRQLVRFRFEAGLSLATLLSTALRTDLEGDQESSLSKFDQTSLDLDSVYLQFTYDGGRLTGTVPESATSGWLNGFAIALSLEEFKVRFENVVTPVSVTIGYAYSPESRAQPAGLFFSSVSLQF